MFARVYMDCYCLLVWLLLLLSLLLRVRVRFGSIEIFIRRIVQLGVESDFDLLRHSWGGLLTADYVAQRQPPGLHRLVISSSPPSEQLWDESMLGYLEAFPAEFKEMVLKHEREGTVEIVHERELDRQ
ncbi:hypothetical protein BDR06DRAFT_973481, partial [Suillus hirtellus]